MWLFTCLQVLTAVGRRHLEEQPEGAAGVKVGVSWARLCNRWQGPKERHVRGEDFGLYCNWGGQGDFQGRKWPHELCVIEKTPGSGAEDTS